MCIYCISRMHTHYASTHSSTCTHIHTYYYTYTRHTAHSLMHTCTHQVSHLCHTHHFSLSLSLTHSHTPFTKFPPLPSLPSLPPSPPSPPSLPPSLPSPPSPPRLVSYELLNESLTEPLKLIISSRSLFFFTDSPPDPHSLLERVDLSDLRECRPVTGKTSECGEGVGVCVCILFSYEKKT